ncbi:MAG: YfhO family protein [Bacteroidota bacterium]|nr:YfhO family protein [Bacteroidota bacterium]
MKKFLPHLIAVLIFTAISFAYFSPLLDGKVLQQSDNVNFIGMSKEIVDYRATTGHEALWTDSMFGGMPSYLISTTFPGNLIKPVDNILQTFPRPAGFLFIYLIGFYVLLLAFKVDKWLSVIGSIAFSFSSYYFIIISAGHNSKVVAIAYVALVIAGIIMAFRGRRLWGAILFAVGLSLELLAGHPQITYYAFMVIFLFGIVEMIFAIRNKTLPEFFKSFAILLLPALLAVGTDLARLLTTLEYGKYSIRGKTELTHNQSNRTTGLDKDYATQWSYGIDETMTLFIPNYKGGSSTGALSEDSKTFEALRQQGVPNTREVIKQLPVYWGDQPFTSGPVYVGAIVFFLFFLGLWIVKGPEKWWLLSATILSIMLAWGKNFMPLTDLFFQYLPGYNKFRTVSMILVIAEFAMPLLGLLALRDIFDKKLSKGEILKGLKWTTIITGGLALIITLIPSISGSFSGASDAQLPGWLLEPLRSDRESILRSDAIRSLVFVLCAAGLIWLYIEEKLKKEHFLVVLGLLMIIDLWPINKRYLNNDQFVRPRQITQNFEKTPADEAILQDKDASYRVMNLNNPFNDSRTSYYHKSIGGYHAAKMRRYQELIDFCISGEATDLINGFRTPDSLLSVMKNLHVLNMLNTRYFIADPNRMPIRNPYAYGNVWTVSNLRVAENADQELEDLKSIDPRTDAVVANSMTANLPKQIETDPTASVRLTSYAPNLLKYDFSANKDQLVVFSEIYYPKGWNAYVDGKLTPHFRADYVLRAMMVPAGKHNIEFKFEPKTYYTGDKISLVSSVILILLVLSAGAFEINKALKKGKKE